MKNKKSIHEKIMALNSENFLKLNVRELCVLLGSAEPEDRKLLFYVMNETWLEYKVKKNHPGDGA